MPKVCLKVRIKYNVVKFHSEVNIDFTGVRSDMQLLMLLHKYVYNDVFDNNALGIVLQSLPQSGIMTRALCTNKLVYPASHKLGCRKSPLYRGIELWNSLDPECRKYCKDLSFKQQAKPTVIKMFHV